MISHYATVLTSFFGTSFKDILYTFITLLFFICFYAIIFFIIKKQDLSFEKKHKRSITLRNVIFLLYIISVLFIWSGEIKTFIISTAALAAAFLIVFKEFLLGILGTLITNKTFYVGDYIEYAQISGKIVDKNFSHTRVLITGPYPNKELVFPNMHYITNQIVNLSKLGKFQVYSISIAVDNLENILPYSNQMLLIAEKHIESHKIKLTSYFYDKKKDDFFFEIPNITPKVTFDINDSKKLTFTIHFLSHPLDREDLEAKILYDYLSYISLSKKGATENED
ncbi:mechanosensitive ion channel [archaeon]|nr:mechanosensitive ion channel [archaeon]NCQ51699.1 mechanosensitive ion channel [archaeon]